MFDPRYVQRLLRFLATELDSSRHVHVVLLWAHELMLSHAPRLRTAASAYEVPLRALHKAARRRYDELSKLCNSNLFSLAFLIDQLQAAAGNDGGSVAALVTDRRAAKRARGIA